MWPGWQKAVYTALIPVCTPFPGGSSRVSPPGWMVLAQTLNKTSPCLVSIRYSITATRKAACRASKKNFEEKNILTHTCLLQHHSKEPEAAQLVVQQWRGVSDSGQSGCRLAGGRHEASCSSESDCQEHHAKCQRPRRSPKTYIKHLQ